LVELLDKRDHDRRRLAREHERLDGGNLAAQPLDRVDLVPGPRFDSLHDFEYAVRPGRKAIVNWLWCGADVMVTAGGH
jgi:hypothetical protein